MDTSMEFEIAMRVLFGDKAYHIADEHLNSDARHGWLTKTLRHLRRDIDDLDTTPHHKQGLLAEIDGIAALLKRPDPSWDLMYRALRFAIRLLGWQNGARCHTPTYWQTPAQHLNSVQFEGGDIMQDYYDEKNAIAIRRSVVLDLKKKGHDDYTISLVLGTTEYQVKKLRSAPKPSEDAGSPAENAAASYDVE